MAERGSMRMTQHVCILDSENIYGWHGDLINRHGTRHWKTISVNKEHHCILSELHGYHFCQASDEYFVFMKIFPVMGDTHLIDM